MSQAQSRHRQRAPSSLAASIPPGVKEASGLKLSSFSLSSPPSSRHRLRLDLGEEGYLGLHDCGICCLSVVNQARRCCEVATTTAARTWRPRQMFLSPGLALWLGSNPTHMPSRSHPKMFARRRGWCACVRWCLSSQLDSIHHQSFVKPAPEMPNRPLVQEPASPAAVKGRQNARLSPWSCLPPWYTEALKINF